MKIHRFIISQLIWSTSKITIFDAAIIHQIKNVLHLQPGEEIIISDGQGEEASALITNFNKKDIELEILHREKSETESNRKIKLYCAILKRDNFEWVVQKCTEVGVTKIIPLITKRTVKVNLNLARLEKISQEAAEQSGRGVLPIISQPVDFLDALEEAKQNQTNFFFDKSGNIFSKIKNKLTEGEGTGVFIGPEGGWEDAEREAAKKSKMNLVSLGKLTLRGETAAIIASYLAVNL